MQRVTALQKATYLLLMPSAVRQFRAAPLPVDVRLLLHILAGDEKTRATAADEAAMLENTVVRAAEFYVREILLAPETTDYRALGCEPNAPREELRANMILLMRWLHPDTAIGPRDDELFEKVGRAWRTMRSDKSRAAYDQALFQNRMSQGRPVSLAIVRQPPTPAAVRANLFLERVTEPWRRRLLRSSIYIVAAMLMFLLVTFLLDHFVGLDEFDISVGREPDARTAFSEFVNFAKRDGAVRFRA